MIDYGELKVVIRDGRMIIALPNDILFESGRTDVKAAGKTALAKVAQRARSRCPTATSSSPATPTTCRSRPAQFPSNWELSTARAVEVVHYLISQGMNPKVLAAAGYGEFDPVDRERLAGAPHPEPPDRDRAAAQPVGSPAVGRPPEKVADD